MKSLSNFHDRMHDYSPLVLRLGVAFVFIWFGWSGISNTDMWTSLVPTWALAIAPATTLVWLHGMFELIFGLLLFAGIWTRGVAFFLLLSLIQTLTLLSWGPVMVRDIAIMIVLLAVVMRKWD